jgi:hypothetical protein
MPEEERDAHNWVVMDKDAVLIHTNNHKRDTRMTEPVFTCDEQLSEVLRAWEPVARAYAAVFCDHCTANALVEEQTFHHGHVTKPSLFFITHAVSGKHVGQPLVMDKTGAVTLDSRKIAHQAVGLRIALYHTRVKEAMGVTDKDILKCKFRCNQVRDDRMTARKRALTDALAGTIATADMISYAVNKQLASENHTSAHAVDVSYCAAHKKKAKVV